MTEADSFVVGIIFACVALLVLMITLMMVSFYFIHKNDTVKKNVRVVSS